MAVKIRQQLVAPARRFQGAGTNRRQYLTIHQTDNFSRGAGAAAHGNLQAGGYKGASWHWTVDDKEAVQSYPETSICWHAGDGSKGTGNTASIAIEICVNPDSNAEIAFDNAAQLAAQILRRNRIPLSRMVQHNHWTGKNCPSQIRKRGDWPRFVALVQKYLTGTTPSPAPAPAKPATPAKLVVDGHFGPASVRRLQRILGTTQDGVLSGQSTASRKYHVRINAIRYGTGGSVAVRALQKKLGVTTDGLLGPATIKAWQKKLLVPSDGYFGPTTAARTQDMLNKGGAW